MKAVKILGEKQMAVVDVPKPEANGHNVIIKVECVGICGSDIHFWELGDLPEYKGLIPGHEHAGVVVDPGSRTDLKVGDRVTSIPVTTPCGKCTDCMEGRSFFCRNKRPPVGNHMANPGTYAEYFEADPVLVRKLSDSISFEDASMIEPAATPYAVVKDLGIMPGDRVLVSGGGIIGSFAAQWCKAFGAEYVAMTEVNEFRGKKNLEEGYVDELFDGRDPDLVQKLIAASGGRGFKYFIECTGNAAALTVGMQVCRLSAMVALVGVAPHPIPVHTMLGIQKRLTLKCYLAYSPAEFEETKKLIEDGVFKVSSQWTRDCKPEEVEDMYRHLQDPKCEDVKIMIRF